MLGKRCEGVNKGRRRYKVCVGGYDKRGCEVCGNNKRMCGTRFVWGISVV